jgi:DNA repair exonuclease SbcCD ATPase subunit
MLVTHLTIENFGPIANTVLHLDGRGLTNIEGVNNDDPSADSNGSGKSTLPDALYWALFNETARGVSGDDVISNFTGKDCLVAVRLKDGDTTYDIERWRKKKGKGKPSGVSLIQTNPDGTTLDLTKGTDKLTQPEIERVLGCSKEVFTKAVYSGQEAMPDLPNMTDKAIKELVEEAAGIEILTRAYELAKKHRLAKEKDETDANRNLQEAERRHGDAVTNLSNITQQRDAWDAGQAPRINRQEIAEADAAAATSRAVGERDKIDRKALDTRLADLQASVSAVSSEQTTLTAFARKVSVASSTATVAKTKLASKMTELRNAKAHLENFDNKVGTPCRECGKAYEEGDIAGAKKIAQTRVTELADEARVLAADAQMAEKAVVEEQAAHDAYKATMTDLTKTMAEIRMTQNDIQSWDLLNNAVLAADRNHQSIRAELERLRTETNPYSGMVAGAEKTVTDRLTEAGDKKKLLEEAQKAASIANGAVAAFGPTGVRAYVLDTVTPYLNSRTSHYLGTLSDGRISAIWTTIATNAKGELVEKFCIEVEKAGTGGKTFKALSGGEKRKVRLACALALQDLVGSRANKPIDLWIGDEIDDALDPAGLERLMAVLEEKAREKGTVLIISHNSLSDYIRETTTVTMDGGKSTVTGSLV